MSVTEQYLDNYQRIAADHVAHWRKTGQNPFQDPRVLKANEDATVALVDRYTPPEFHLLDVGCGMGDLIARFQDRISIGIDIASPYLEVAENRGLHVERWPAEDIGWDDEHFHTVVATDILEHVLDVNAAVREMLRVLKPGGHLIVRVPNMESVPWHIPPERPYRFVHLRIFDEGTLRLLFDRIFGCEVVECFAHENSLHCVARKP